MKVLLVALLLVTASLQQTTSLGDSGSGANTVNNQGSTSDLPSTAPP